jgi:glycine oxidase
MGGARSAGGGAPRVVVVGGGVIGQAIAWRVAASGAEVVVVDPRPGRAASWVAAGMLAPVAEAGPGEEAVTALNRASAARWPAFAAALADASGLDPGYTTRGTLLVARDGDDVEELAQAARRHEAAGLPAERLRSREARQWEPALGPHVRGALWLPDDHQVDNRAVLAALAEAGRRAGVRTVARPATRLTGREVVLDGGDRLAADVVVAATGAWPPPVEVDGEPFAVPVRPVKGQILRLRATSTAVFPTRSIRALDCYIVPRRHGEIVVGATVEEQGYDTTVTAGGVLDLLRNAWEVVPGLAEAAFVEAIAGLRPGTPDNVPVIGRVGGDRGPVLALGHYRHGVLLAPLTADLVAGLVRDGTTAPAGDAALLAACDPYRPALGIPEAVGA